MTEDKMQKKYLQFQTLQQQIEQISEHGELLNQQLAELDISVNAVKELGKTKVNEEVLAPIANGVFLKAELKDNQKLIVNVGAGITVEKTVPEVVKLLEKQEESIANKITEAQQVLDQLQEQAMKIYQEIQEEAK